MNIEQSLLLIIALCIIILLLVLHGIKGFNIKWHMLHQCYCIYYEIWVDRDNPITHENERELKLVVRRLPKFLNILKQKK